MRALCLVCVLAAPAAAGKPTDAQAKQVVARWVAAMDLKHHDAAFAPDAADPLTAPGLMAAAYDDEGAPCPATTATGAARTKLLACLHAHVTPADHVAVWTAKSARRLWGPLLDHKKQLAELAKTATLVELHDGCDGMETWVILAVSQDTKHVARISAVLAEYKSCSE